MIHRQDAWSDQEDRRLAEVVLEHIRSGSTQLKAFDQVGDELDRTSAACGFRWNALIRQKYEEEIKQAKRERKQRIRNKARRAAHQITTPQMEQTELTLEQVISYLEKMKLVMKENKSSPEKLENEVKELKGKKEQLEEQVKQLTEHTEEIHQEYTMILSMMNRVRQLSNQEGESRLPHVFPMETNNTLKNFSNSS